MPTMRLPLGPADWVGAGEASGAGVATGVGTGVGAGAGAVCFAVGVCVCFAAAVCVCFAAVGAGWIRSCDGGLGAGAIAALVSSLVGCVTRSTSGNAGPFLMSLIGVAPAVLGPLVMLLPIRIARHTMTSRANDVIAALVKLKRRTIS